MKAQARLGRRPIDRNSRKKLLIVACAVWLVIGGLGAVSSLATPLPEGSVLPNYAVVSVGPSSSIFVNSGPITGNVLLGDGNTSGSSGGGNGQVTGHVDVSPPASGDFLAHIQIAPTINTVDSSVGVMAFNDAVALSNAASGLSPTQTFGAVTGALTINGNGGLNVIDIASLSNPDITINGGSSDNFVFNVSGNFQTNHVMTLNGVTASQILWNMTGTSGNIFETSGGDVLFGTFLATNGGDFQFSNLDLTGQLINTAGHMQIVSGSQVTIPEPNTYGLIGIGAMALAFARNRIRRGLR
jgi:PEP-CTERM motif